MKFLICADLFSTSCGKLDGPEKPTAGPKVARTGKSSGSQENGRGHASAFRLFALIRIELLAAPLYTGQKS
jgi:hypothetical protein